MADEPKSALEAMNAALAGEVPDEPLEDTAAAADDSADDVSTVAADDDPDAAGDTKLDDPEDESGGEDSDGAEPAGEASTADIAAEAEKLGVSVRRANGEFKSKEELLADVSAAKAAAAQSDGKGDKPGAAKKEADPVNDPIDKNLKPATQERIRTLIDRTKEAEAKVEEATNNFNYLVQGVQATGATPEQYGETLSWLSLFNSGDQGQQEKALEIIEGVADRLATMLGRERSFTDPLKVHPDLQQAIQQGKITKELAAEVARTRNQGTFRTQLTTAASEQQRVQQAAHQEAETARTDLNTLEDSLKATDPLYEQKKAVILPTLKVLFPQIRPAMWKEAFTKAYREVKVAPRVVSRPRPAVAGGNQPLRANKSGVGAGAGGKMAEAGPKTALDAINAALAGMK